MHIEKGHKHNAKVVLRGEAGYSEPGIQPGDVIFVLEQKPHKTFKRIQADLVIEKASAPYCLTVVWSEVILEQRMIEGWSGSFYLMLAHMCCHYEHLCCLVLSQSRRVSSL